MKKILSVLALAVLLSACSSISKEQAEGKALEFVKANVKFYTKGSENRSDVPSYNFDRMTSYEKDGVWNVAVHVSAIIANDTKENDILVGVDKNGKVVSMNGKEVPQ